jgi:hypothetical protein
MHAQTRVVRRVAPLVAVLLLAGCGTETGTESPAPGGTSAATATDMPTTAPPSSPTRGPGTSGHGTPLEDWDPVAVFTVTNADGKVSPGAVGIEGLADVQAFSAQFTNPAVERRLTRLVTQGDLMPGRSLVAAVVAIGCSSPREVTVSTLDGRLLVAAVPPPNSPPECLVAMTTVALVAVPTELAPPPASAS